MVGHVFRHYLRAYSHWAFGDIDVIYGALRNVLTAPVLSHDIITFRTDDLCFPMSKTIFAGQLSIFANNNWTRSLYSAPSRWAQAALDARFLFFDERILPLDVLNREPGRVAMVIAQLSDRTNGRRPSPRRFSRRLLWLAQSGRLVVVQTHGEKSGPGRATIRSRCVESEFAMVHLQLYKFKHFSASHMASGAKGFVYTLHGGILPLNASREQDDPEALVVAGLLARGELHITCERNGGSWMYEGTVPP